MIRIVRKMNKKSCCLGLIRFQTRSMSANEEREVKFLEHKGIRKVYALRI